MRTRSTIVVCFLFLSISVAGQTPDPALTVADSGSLVMNKTMATDEVTVIGLDAAGRAITSDGPAGSTAFRYLATASMEQIVDRFGNRLFQVQTNEGVSAVTMVPLGFSAWSEIHTTDAAGKVMLQGVDWESASVGDFASAMGIPLAFPDWLQISFSTPRTISTVKVYTLQDNYFNPIEPTPDMRFTNFGLTDFEVQYWFDTPALKKWVVVPSGVIVGNRNVIRKIDFPPVTTTKIRLVVKNALGHYSRITEVEVFDTDSENVALPQYGSSATASSAFSAGFSPAFAINGDRTGRVWGSTGGWNDATPDTVKLAAATVTETTNPFNRYITVQNPIAKVTQTINLTPPPTTPPQMGYPYSHGMEQTESMGKVFQARLVETYRGKEIWDNQGGSQWFGHDPVTKKMIWVADWSDYVIKIVRDSSGRPTHLYLGDNGLLRFTYDTDGLKSKEYIDLRTNMRLYRANRPATAERSWFPRTRQMLQTILPGHGPIAEFDKTVSDKGFVLASLFGRPYALIPFVNTGPIYNEHMPVRWIITLYPEDAILDLVDRIEYNEDEIIVRFGTWAAFPGTARHTVAISLPRYYYSPTPSTFGQDTSYMPYVPNVPNVAAFVSDGGSSLNDPCPVGAMCVTETVTAQADPLPATPPSYPPVNSGPPPGNGNGQMDPFNRRSLQGGALAKTEVALEEAKYKLKNKPDCAALFQTLANAPGERPVDPSWETALRRLTNIASGNGRRNSAGQVPCNWESVLMWMEQPRASSLYVCPRVENENQVDVTYAFIHELLHVGGLFELPDRRATITHAEISRKVNAACN